MARPYTTLPGLVNECQVAVFVAVWDTEMSAARPLTTAQTRQNRGFQVTLAQGYQIGICNALKWVSGRIHSGRINGGPQPTAG